MKSICGTLAIMLLFSEGFAPSAGANEPSKAELLRKLRERQAIKRHPSSDVASKSEGASDESRIDCSKKSDSGEARPECARN